MNKEFKKLLLDKLGEVLINQQFYVADLGSNYCVYHRRNGDYIEIIQWAEDKYKNILLFLHQQLFQIQQKRNQILIINGLKNLIMVIQIK